MHSAPFKQRTTERRAAIGCDWNISDILNEFARKTVRFGAIKDPDLLTSNNSLLGIAERRRSLNEGLQHCVQVEGRTTDDLKDVSCGGLPLEPCAKIVEYTRDSEG